MDQLSHCPICKSADIKLAYHSGTHRRTDDPARWTVFNCRSCAHGFMNPQPSWDELSSYYSEEYEPYIENHGAEAAQDAQAVAEARASGTFRHLPIPDGKRVLDVGCGAGWFLRICKQLGAHTFGIEPSTFGTKCSRAAGIEVFNGMVGDYLEQHGTERKFDVITANHVIEHAADPVQTLRDMAGLLAPGGTMWISVPNAAGYFSRELGGAWHSADLPYHLHQFSPQSLKLAGAGAGLGSNRLYTYSLPVATAASLRDVLRKRWLLPKRITVHLGFLNQGVAGKMAASLDHKVDGEAVIAEFAAAA
jgi:SAM-dependent methyltransferase